MSIQSTINQGLSLASLLISQNPRLKAMGEKKAAVREIHGKMKKENELFRSIATAEGASAEDRVKDLEELGAQAVQTTKQLLEVDPTRPHYESYAGARDIYSELRGHRINAENMLRDAEAKAQEASRLEAERLSKSRAFAKMVMEGDK